MRVVFLGTPEFAVPSLRVLVTGGHEVLGVFTQPDRPKGRGQKDAASAVKRAAMEMGLAVHQPERVRRPEVVEQLRGMGAEMMIVVGYGQIIPQSILDIPPRGIVNVHASLLPKYRGAAPIQWAIARGEERTGVTTMKIDAGLDTGDMLLKWETEIGAEETAVELGARLAVAGADLLARTLGEWDAIRPEKQDDSQASWAPVIKKEDGHIDWKMSGREIVNRIRGFTPWPGCYGFLRGQRMHVWKARVDERTVGLGEMAVEGRRLLIGCSGGSIEALEVQMEGKKRMAAAAFLNGFAVQAGEVIA